MLSGCSVYDKVYFYYYHKNQPRNKEQKVYKKIKAAQVNRGGYALMNNSWKLSTKKQQNSHFFGKLPKLMFLFVKQKTQRKFDFYMEIWSSSQLFVA